MILSRLLKCLDRAGILSEKNIADLHIPILMEEIGSEFFSEMIKIKPNSYEARRGLAESFMSKGEFREAAKQWEILCNKICFRNINVLSRLIECYFRTDSIEDAKRTYEHMLTFFSNHDLTVRARNVLLSKLNARFEISIDFGEVNNEFPRYLEDFKKILTAKCKDEVNYRIIKKECIEMPYVDISYNDGRIMSLYPLITNEEFIFKIKYLINTSKLTINIGRDCYVGSVRKKEISGVLKGKEGWLFLKNDTNMSIEQFKGERLIEEVDIQEWKSYLKKIREKSKIILLIVPSKESVYPQFYPYQQGRMRPIDQLKRMVNEEGVKNFIYPVELLRKNTFSYYKTDTHYSYLGAKIVFEELAKRFFEININELADLYPLMEFGNYTGDLGSKSLPIMQEKVPLIRYDYRDKLIYDNGLENTNRISYYKNKGSVNKKKILFFGGSSTLNIAPYFISVFEEFLSCRTSATILMEMVENYEPDYIIAQINERFIVKAPQFLSREESNVYNIDLNPLNSFLVQS